MLKNIIYTIPSNLKYFEFPLGAQLRQWSFSFYESGHWGLLFREMGFLGALDSGEKAVQLMS